MDCLKQTIDQKGYLMYKSNLTEQVIRAINQIDIMIFATYIYCVRFSNLSAVNLLLKKRITTVLCKVRKFLNLNKFFS